MSDGEKKTYSQEDYDGVVNEVTRLRAEKRELETKISDLGTRLDTVESEKKKAETEREQAAHVNKGEYDKALQKAEEAYKSKLDELNKKLEDSSRTIENLMIDGKILSIADNAVNPEQVKTLLKAAYKFEVKDGAVTITSTDGKPILDDKGNAISIEGAYAKFLADNPHLEKPGSATGGSGSRSKTPPIKTEPDDIESQIHAALKAGDRQRVIKLKAQKMNLQGPHSLKS